MVINLLRLRRIVLVLLLLALLVVVLINSSWFWKIFYPLPYREAIFSSARQFRVDPYLIAAVIRVESRFYARAESHRGARGLMQIMPETAAWAAREMGLEFHEDKLFEPEFNILIGTWYLANLQAEFQNNLPLVLAAYNGGRGNVRHWLEKKPKDRQYGDLEWIPFAETRYFVQKVLRDYRMYRRLYASEHAGESVNPYFLGK
ncbi:lytic transglycosylase domain-containing protein [Calderihabitans maritimus]|nr:lytic transglycosylase domain-containing protein [Calderihabitans maritimus]